MSYVRYTHFTIIIATYIASYSFPTNYMHVLINYSTTDDAELHDDGTIVLDSEEEPLEEEDGSRNLIESLKKSQVMSTIRGRIAVAGHLVPSFIMRTTRLYWTLKKNS